MRARHILAFALLLSGCFDSHGRGRPVPSPPPLPPPGADAGPPGMCRPSSGGFEALDCPATAPVGSTAQVEVQHHAGACCDRGAGEVSAIGTREGFELRSDWSVCDCCDDCDCLSPIAGEAVSVGPIAPGANRVVAGAFECVIEGVDAERCQEVPSDAIAPRVLFAGQPFGATLVHGATADCGCLPRLTRSGSSADLRLCECGDACDAVLTSYGGSWVEEGLLPIGERRLVLGGEPHRLRVIDLEGGPLPGAACRPIEPTGLTIVGPADHHDGPRIWWALVDVMQPLCCSPDGPDIGAVTGIDRGGGILVEPMTCTLEDCFCANPAPTPGQAAVLLGELPPGEQTVRAGAFVETFVVR